MSDTVTIHNGHCSYHGPADKAPVWAARVASTDHKISPAPTRSPMNSIAPVPAQTVAADAVPAPLTSFEDTSHAWEEGYRAGRAEGKALVSSWRFRANAAEQQLFDRWRQSLAESGADAPSGDLISREAEGFDAAMKMLFALLDNPAEADIMRHAVENLLGSVTEARIRARSAAPIGKEIW